MSTEVNLTVTADEAAYLESMLRLRRDTIADMPEDWISTTELAEVEIIEGLHPKLADAETRAIALGLVREAEAETAPSQEPVEMLFLTMLENLLASVLTSFVNGDAEDAESAAMAEAARIVTAEAEGFSKLVTVGEFVHVLYDFFDSALDNIEENYGEDMTPRQRRETHEHLKSLRASCLVTLASLEDESA